jgi:hypothetical protein
MTFMEALSAGLPMRRERSSGVNPWLHLGNMGESTGEVTPCWRDISTGRMVGLWRWDYTADDWEIMGKTSP